jgi:DNA-binding PadR family transcriptional regulator
MVSNNINHSISLRDQLVLLLVARSGINNIFQLVMKLDRCDFPGSVEKNLSLLLDRQLIYVSAVDKFSHAIKYTATEKGEDFLKNNMNSETIIEHIKKMSDPDFMLELVQAIFNYESNSETIN